MLGNSKYVKLHLYVTLWELNLHTFNYKVIAHVNFSQQGWNLYQFIQYETAIPSMYSLFIEHCSILYQQFKIERLWTLD